MRAPSSGGARTLPLSRPTAPISRLHLAYISPTSPLHLPYIPPSSPSQATGACADARAELQAAQEAAEAALREAVGALGADKEAQVPG